MKILLTLLITAIFATSTYSQKVISKSEYDGNFNGSVSVTNDAFPFVFTVVTETFENGKLVSTETEVNERQAEGVERSTTTLIKNGKTLRGYSIMVGFDNQTYCSSDGKKWVGPQEYVCPSVDGNQFLKLTAQRKPEKAEYSVTPKTIAGKSVKVYREYAVFASRPNGRKEFTETVATIDARGYFIEVIDTEGFIEPRTVMLIRKQTWKTDAKFPPVVAPFK